MGTLLNRPAIIIMVLVMMIFISCTSNHEKQLRLLEEAHNNHDIEQTLSIYAEDARFVLVGGWVAQGKENLRERFEWDFALNGSLFFTNYQITKDTIICRVEERNDFFLLLGIDVVNYEYSKFIFEHGLIKEVEAKVSQQSIEMIDHALSDFMLWASSERMLDLNEVVADGNPVFKPDKAEKWLRLLRTFALSKELKEIHPPVPE